MVIARRHIRFRDRQVPKNEGYRSYLKDRVQMFARHDPDHHGLFNCVAAIVLNCGHTSASDRRNYATVDFYVLSAEGKAEFLVTQHVPAMALRTWQQRQTRRR